MWWAVLFLFISGSAGATALGLWLFFRRRRRGPQRTAGSQRRTVQPAIQALQAESKDRQASSEPAEAAVRVPLEDETPYACPLAATIPAVSDAAEALEERGSANAEESVPAGAAAPESAQEAESGSFAEGGEGCADAPVPAVGTAPRTIRSLDTPSPSDAEEAILGADCHPKTSSAAADWPGTKAGIAETDPQPLLFDMAAPSHATTPDGADHSVLGSVTSA